MSPVLRLPCSVGRIGLTGIAHPAAATRCEQVNQVASWSRDPDAGSPIEPPAWWTSTRRISNG